MTAETSRAPAAANPTARRSVVGLALVAIGVLHIALTPVFYGEALRSVVEAGVVASVEADPALVDLRSAGFWYVNAGIGMLLLGLVVAWAERRTGTIPGFLGWVLLGLAAWGLLLMPASGYWAVLVVALLAIRSAHQAPQAA